MTFLNRTDWLEGARNIPEATVARLPIYLRALSTLSDQGVEVCSSTDLATAAGVNPAKLRKDLSHLGSYGTRGVGYDVDNLSDEIARALGQTRERDVVIVGVGHLGSALSAYRGFGSRGIRIAALIDADPAKIGSTIAGITVESPADLPDIVRDRGISIAVIATPGPAAQLAADALVAAGITSILNFAPAIVVVPADVNVRMVDLSIELQILAYHEQRNANPGDTGVGQEVAG